MEEKVLQLLEKMYAEFTERFDRIEAELKAITNKTADLTEFQTDTTEKLDYLIENSKSVNEVLGEHEISIRSLRRKPV